MATGLGALTEGFQSGYKFSRDSARDKLIDKALDFEISRMGEGKKSREDAYKRFGLDYASAHEFQPETWGSRTMNWIKGKFGMGQGGGTAINPMELQAPQTTYEDYASQDPGSVDGGIPRRAHGGAVRHYADGGKAETEKEKRERYARLIEEGRNKPTYTGDRPGLDVGDLSAVAENIGSRTTDLVEAVKPNIMPNTQRRMDEWRPKGIAADRAVLDAEGAAERGSAIRSDIAEGGRGIGQLAAGIYEDTGVGSLVKGAGGFFGYGTGSGEDEKAAAVRALPTDDTPEQAAESIAAQPAPAQPTGAGGGAGQVTPGAAAPATGADQTGVEDDPIIDFSQVREVRPEEMPNKGMKEWQDERNFYAAQAVANDRDPLEAMKAVDAKQMRGFTMYGQQAFQLLRSGNAPAAANALYAAYQYFPNGKDVRFGVMEGEDGRPVIIGMGTDEETGEPAGKPMVMTAESLAVQIENMSNPAAFKTWTKDWRDTEQKIRKYMEVDKPTAQSMATYRAKAGDAALLNAQARLEGAIRGTNPLKQSDYDRAFSAMSEDADTMALFEDVPPDEADYLKSVMAVAYRNNPGNFPRISQVIKQAYRDGGIAAVDEMVSGGGGGP